jgi:sugar O-acyltransferase (sialic acid O-acetyltransferase NeuD family)
MLIAGAGGHAIEILDIILETFPEAEVFFFDDLNNVEMIHGTFPVLKTEAAVRDLFKKDNRFCIGVGPSHLRYALYQKMQGFGGRHQGVRAKSAEVSNFSSSVDPGVDLCKQTFISSLTEIGLGTLINTGAKIHHHVKIGTFCEIGPGAMLLGKSQVGSRCFIGAGATLLPQVRVCDDIVVGAGAVVISDITIEGTYAGVPAKKIK